MSQEPDIVFFFVPTCRRIWEENQRFWELGRKIGGNEEIWEESQETEEKIGETGGRATGRSARRRRRKKSEFKNQNSSENHVFFSGSHHNLGVFLAKNEENRKFLKKGNWEEIAAKRRKFFGVFFQVKIGKIQDF